MRTVWKAVTAMVIVGAVVVGANAVSAYVPMRQVVKSDDRNQGIGAVAYHQWLVNPAVLVVDVREVDPQRSMADVTRVLLRFAERMKDRSFDRVVLSASGTPKFYLEGQYFRKIGEESQSQNPIYTIRTMPQNVKELDGRNAFPEWTGGMIGVLGRQMDDFNELHRQWWVEEALKP